VPRKQVTKVLKSLVGEYLVAAYLCSKGYFVSVMPKGMPRVDLIVYDIEQGKARLVQVKAFSGRSNKCPLIGVSTTFDNIDEILEEKVKHPYVFVELLDDVKQAKLYVLGPSDVRELAKEAYLEWLTKKHHRKSIEEIKNQNNLFASP